MTHAPVGRDDGGALPWPTIGDNFRVQTFPAVERRCRQAGGDRHGRRRLARRARSRGGLRDRRHAEPSPSQLYPRNLTTNSANVTVSGTVTTGGITGVRLDATREGDGAAVSSTTASVSGLGAGFTLTASLPAGLHTYRVSLYVLGGSGPVLQKSWNDLVAGDAYLVNGQSNAAAYRDLFKDGNPYNVDTSNSSTKEPSPFVRTFGSSTSDPAASSADNTWRQADGDAYQAPGAVGQYAWRLGWRIVTTYGIPVALLNGAENAKPISHFQRDDRGPDENYGRLFDRARRAGLTGSIRGVLWYQGESDDNNVTSQRTGFTNLLSAWRSDYPDLGPVYVHQIRNGCRNHITNLPQASYQEREAQRQYADTLGVTVLSTNGVDGHGSDNCHYYYADGYAALADHDFFTIAHDLYGGSASASRPPNPNAAWFSNTAHTEITIQLRNTTDAINVDCGADHGFLINGNPVRMVVAASPGYVALRLPAAPTSPVTLSYVGHDGPGPWVANTNRIGMLSFYGLALSADHIRPFPSPVPNCPTGNTRLTAGDFNTDGKADIASTDASNNMQLYPGNGGGLVSGGSLMMPTGGLWTNFHGITAGDFNSDGKADIAGIDANNDMRLYIGNGTGTLSGGSPMLPTGGLWTNFHGITAGDFNSDGRADIAGIDANKDIQLYRGTGTGTLSAGSLM
jgi:hypothetical protein